MSAISIRPPASRKHLASSRSIERLATPQISAVRSLTYWEARYGPPAPSQPGWPPPRRPSAVVLIASHISALITSRTVRAPSRARSMLASIEPGRSASSVSCAERLGCCWARSSTSPSIASRPPEPKLTPASASGVPCSSAWKTASTARAVNSARARLRPSQYSSWAMRASISALRGTLPLLLLLLLLLAGPRRRSAGRAAPAAGCRRSAARRGRRRRRPRAPRCPSSRRRVRS